jgi:hypothetical protein
MDFEKAYDGGDKDQYDTAVIYLAKMAGGMAVGIATLIDATSAAAPLLKKLAVRYGTDVVIEAVETATERVVAWATLRSVSILLGWEAVVALLLLQALVDCLTPNQLEAWCSRCAFGTGRESLLWLADHAVTPYTDPSQQEKDYVDAMTRLT